MLLRESLSLRVPSVSVRTLEGASSGSTSTRQGTEGASMEIALCARCYRVRRRGATRQPDEGCPEMSGCRRQPARAVPPLRIPHPYCTFTFKSGRSHSGRYGLTMPRRASVLHRVSRQIGGGLAVSCPHVSCPALLPPPAALARARCHEPGGGSTRRGARQASPSPPSLASSSETSSAKVS